MVLHLAPVLHAGLHAEITRIVAVTDLLAKTTEMDISRVCQATALLPHLALPTLLNQTLPTLLNQTLLVLLCRLQ
jgi:N-acyl-L-homoserine lactone synthetase